jgi:xylonate dehydratase
MDDSQALLTAILHASPESAAGGGLSWLHTGDQIRINLNTGRCDALVDDEEIARRKAETPPATPASNTPWEELYRATVGSLETGACMELAVPYTPLPMKPPRHNH